MIRIVLAALFLITTLFQSAAAGPRHGITATAATSGTTGFAQMNLGPSGIDSNGTNFIDMLKSAGASFASGALPQGGTAASADIDVNGYPTKAYTGAYSPGFNGQQLYCSASVKCSFVWGAGTKGAILINSATANCVFTGTGGTVSGCSNNNTTLTMDGTGAGAMSFNSNGGLAGALFWLNSPTFGYGAAGTANLALVRDSDLTAYQTYAGTNDARGIYTPEYLSVLQGLNLKTIREMEINNTNTTNAANAAYLPTKSNMGWIGGRYPKGVWGGTISGTDALTVAALPTDSGSGGWVDGEVVQGNVTGTATKITVSNVLNNGSGLCQLTVSSTTTLTTGQQVWSAFLTDNATGGLFTPCSGPRGAGIFTITVIDAGCSSACRIDLQGSTFTGTWKPSSGGVVGTQTITVTGKSGGAKFLATIFGVPIFGTGQGFDVLTAGIGNFTYSAALDRVIYAAGGITGSIPMAAQASLANYLNSNLHYTYPIQATDAFMSAQATLALNNLNSGLKFMPEVSNEVWNSNTAPTSFGQQIGLAFGFPVGSFEAVHGFYALRFVQMAIIHEGVWASRRADLRPYLGWQNAISDVFPNKNYRFQGADLAPSGTSTGIGNAFYSTYTSNANYTVFPNRPIDHALSGGYAPYTAGTNFSDQGGDGGTTATAANASVLQTLATAFDANPNDPTALALLDQDQRGLVPEPGSSFTVTCPTGSTFSGVNNFSSQSFQLRSRVLFQVSGGTICNGLVANQAYCVASATGTTFQVSNYVATTGQCGTPISVTPGTGTVTVGPVNNNSLSVFKMSSYPIWDAVFGSYDSVRATNPDPFLQAPLRVEWYEGASRPVPPSTATLSSIGVLVGGSAAAANAALTAGLAAWGNNALSAAFMNDYYGYATAFPHTKTPSNLTWPGLPANPYGLVLGLVASGTRTQKYNGVANFVGVP